MSAEREKTGVFIGSHAINPMTSERIPIWVADYVLPGYGTGAIMAVPAHDERDGAFARTYDLADPVVVRPASGELPDDEAFVAHTADEVLVDSASSAACRPARRSAPSPAAGRPGDRRPGRELQDPRLAGQPSALLGRTIPIVYCPEHGAQPVPEDQLPVLLPEDVDFAPTGVTRCSRTPTS